MFYPGLIRPFLFRHDAEEAHEQALEWAESIGRSRVLREGLEPIFTVDDRRLCQTIAGLHFPNPIGLAAGFDKNAVAVEFWPALGFGFVEIGTVTSRSQPGNPKPRLHRLVAERAVINRMGFNNDGAAAIAARLAPPPHRIPIGVNLGKSKVTPLETATEDYRESLRQFAGLADFFVINVSSPNTPGLRQLQGREMLDALLRVVVSERAGVPVFLKLAPDLTFDQLDDAIQLAQQHRLAGIVATNTTIDHPTPPEGGLSGAPLRARATECVRHIYRRTEGKLPIIGVGGVFHAADAYEKIRAGASLVEVWTGIIYEGPAIVRNINRGLLRFLERDGFNSVAEAVGSEKERPETTWPSP